MNQEESLNVEEATLRHAKTALTDAARQLDPLEALKNKPYVLLGAATVIGVILGLSETRLAEVVKLFQSLSGALHDALHTASETVKHKKEEAEAKLKETPPHETTGG